jgi:hypothetical protein
LTIFDELSHIININENLKKFNGNLNENQNKIKNHFERDLFYTML